MDNKFDIDDVVYWLASDNSRFVNVLGIPERIRPPILAGKVSSVSKYKDGDRVYYLYTVYDLHTQTERDIIKDDNVFATLEEAKAYLKGCYDKLYELMLAGLDEYKLSVEKK